MICDAAAPGLIAWAGRALFRYDVNADDLALTERERASLEPLADRAAAQLVLKMDPVTVFASVYLAVTFAKMRGAKRLPAKPRKDPAPNAKP
jgi:hypothetical protein